MPQPNNNPVNFVFSDVPVTGMPVLLVLGTKTASRITSAQAQTVTATSNVLSFLLTSAQGQTVAVIASRSVTARVTSAQGQTAFAQATRFVNSFVASAQAQALLARLQQSGTGWSSVVCVVPAAINQCSVPSIHTECTVPAVDNQCTVAAENYFNTVEAVV